MSRTPRKPRKREREEKSATASARAAPRGEPEGIDVRAVKTTRGRAATTIQVEIEPERVTGRPDPEAVQEVTAELPRVEGGERSPRWEAQPLVKAGEQVDHGAPKVRYVATRYEGSDLSNGIRVSVKTCAGTLAKDGVRVREADKPEDPGR